MSDNEMDRLVSLLKAIANETRLKLLGLIADRERSVGELAELLDLKEPTISHHLALLAGLDLVAMRAVGTTHFYRLNSRALQALNRDLLAPDRMARLVQPDVAAADQKVLATFLDGERLTKIPDQLRKRMVILRWLADRFEEGVTYPERELNATIKRHHPDASSLRRELVQFRFLAREHGQYWRVSEAERLAFWSELRGSQDALSAN